MCPETFGDKYENNDALKEAESNLSEDPNKLAEDTKKIMDDAEFKMEQMFSNLATVVEVSLDSLSLEDYAQIEEIFHEYNDQVETAKELLKNSSDPNNAEEQLAIAEINKQLQETKQKLEQAARFLYDLNFSSNKPEESSVIEKIQEIFL